MHVVGCVGATHPVAGELDWGWWDCAAASRTDCPNGLAVGDGGGATPDTQRSEHETDRNDKGHDDSEAEQTRGAKQGGERVGGRQQRSGHKKFSPGGLWERQRVHEG